MLYQLSYLAAAPILAPLRSRVGAANLIGGHRLAGQMTEVRDTTRLRDARRAISAPGPRQHGGPAGIALISPAEAVDQRRLDLLWEEHHDRTVAERE
jgi:hypothetical protein